MVSGKNSMGNHKHFFSGKSQKSPKLKMQEKLEAEKNERKAKPFHGMSVKDLFKK